MAQKNVNPGTAPVKWSTVNRAFQDINDNFTELYNSVSFAVDPTNLSSSLVPSATDTYDLGSLSNRWRDLYLTGSTIYLGSAQISTNLDNDYSNTRSLQGQANKFAYFPYAKNIGFRNKSGLR